MLSLIAMCIVFARPTWLTLAAVTLAVTAFSFFARLQLLQGFASEGVVITPETATDLLSPSLINGFVILCVGALIVAVRGAMKRRAGTQAEKSAPAG